MNIGVLSDTRMPTKPSGGHGLGRLAWDIAEGLMKRDHEVTLFAGPESEPFYPSRNSIKDRHADEAARADELAGVTSLDIFIDLSHHHDLSQLDPARPVLNWIADTECQYQPPRAIVGNEWQRKAFPKARIVPLGINVEAIPFRSSIRWPDELIYCAKIASHKGFDLALQVGERTGKNIRFAGENLANAQVPNYIGEIKDDAALYDYLGGGLGLLSPCREDAGGRVNLEAAACGTPVLCLDGTGTMCHVEHCVSGFICRNVDEMAEAVADLPLLDRAKCREWVAETHGTRRMIDGLLSLAEAALAGETW